MSRSWPSNIVIMMPVFNDWEAVGELLHRLDEALHDKDLEARVLLVNDASIDPLPERFADHPFVAIQQVEVLTLRRNVGNQRAIAIGVAHVQQHMSCQALLIMDGDGEDDPKDVPRLIEAMHEQNETCIIFAARMKRSESLTFLIFYHLYRFLHLLLTGIAVRVGNFSVVPAAYLKRLVLLPEMWNHYAAAVFKSRIPYRTLPTQRAPRLAGRSRMNFAGLVAHGLSAVSVFSEFVGVRLLIGTCALGLFTGLALLAVPIAVFSLGLEVPSWCYSLIGLLVLPLVQSLVLGIVFVMVILNSRSTAHFLPVRDHEYFVDGWETLFRAPDCKEVPSGAFERECIGRG